MTVRSRIRTSIALLRCIFTAASRPEKSASATARSFRRPIVSISSSSDRAATARCPRRRSIRSSAPPSSSRCCRRSRAAKIAPAQPVVVTVGSLHAGTTFNVIPERAANAGNRPRFRRCACAGVSRAHRASHRRAVWRDAARIQVRIHWVYPPTVNDPAMNDVVREVARDVLGAATSSTRIRSSCGPKTCRSCSRSVRARISRWRAGRERRPRAAPQRALRHRRAGAAGRFRDDGRPGIA